MIQIKQLSIYVISLISIIISVSLPMYQYFHYHNPVRIKLSDYPELPASEAIYKIEQSYSKNPDYNYISGYIYAIGHSTEAFNSKLVLYNDNLEYAYYYNLSMVERPDLLSETDITNYTYCGFERDLDIRILKSDNLKIGFLINIDNTMMLIKTNQPYSIVETP